MELETKLELHIKSQKKYFWCWKCRVAELIDVEQYDKILFGDADCLALRNIDHLLEGDWDIRYQPERDRPANGKSFNAFLTEAEMALAARREGANSGTLAVKASLFHEVMAEWQAIDESEPLRDSGFRDQASWNTLLQRKGKGFRAKGAGGDLAAAGGAEGDDAGEGEGRWRVEPFPVGEVQFPGYLNPHYSDYTKAALTHNILPDTKEKIEFTFGLYMRTFFCDPTGLFFSMLEM